MQWKLALTGHRKTFCVPFTSDIGSQRLKLHLVNHPLPIQPVVAQSLLPKSASDSTFCTYTYTTNTVAACPQIEVVQYCMSTTEGVNVFTQHRYYKGTLRQNETSHPYVQTHTYTEVLHTDSVTHAHSYISTDIHPAVVSCNQPVRTRVSSVNSVWQWNLFSPPLLCSQACGRQKAVFHFIFLWGFGFIVCCCLFIRFLVFELHLPAEDLLSTVVLFQQLPPYHLCSYNPSHGKMPSVTSVFVISSIGDC